MADTFQQLVESSGEPFNSSVTTDNAAPSARDDLRRMAELLLPARTPDFPLAPEPGAAESVSSSDPRHKAPCLHPEDPHRTPPRASGLRIPGMRLVAARAAMVAAVSGSNVDPQSLQQLLYLQLAVSAALQSSGQPQQQQMGTIMAAGLQLLVGEVIWLVRLLQLSHGPGSPHLRCLLLRLAVPCQEGHVPQQPIHRSCRKCMQHTADAVRTAIAGHQLLPMPWSRRAWGMQSILLTQHTLSPVIFYM
jgi:hypothetical protein